MKVTADRKALAEAATTVAKVISKRMGPDISLAGMHVTAHSGIVALTGTNLETGRRIEVEADVDAEGDAVVDVRLAQALRSAPGDQATLSLADSKLRVNSGDSLFRLRTFRLEDYPEEPNPTGDEIDVEDWRRVRHLATVAGGESARPILTGVGFGDGAMAATDSYRLAWVETDGLDDVSIIVPAHAIATLDAEEVRLRHDGRIVKATVDGGAWWARLIEGTFAKWRGLLNQAGEPTWTVTVDTEALGDAIGRARVVLDENAPLILEPGVGSTLVVSGKRSGDVVYAEEVDAKVEGEGDPVHFNPGYLASMVAPVVTAELRITDAFKPTLVSGDGWWNGLIMPVRV